MIFSPRFIFLSCLIFNNWARNNMEKFNKSVTCIHTYISIYAMHVISANHWLAFHFVKCVLLIKLACYISFNACSGRQDNLFICCKFAVFAAIMSARLQQVANICKPERVLPTNYFICCKHTVDLLQICQKQIILNMGEHTWTHSRTHVDYFIISRYGWNSYDID